MGSSLEQRVEALEQIVAKLQAKTTIEISKNLSIGDTFDLAGAKWKILDITDAGYLCLAERLEQSMAFDSSCNDWKTSNLRNYLNTEFLAKITEEIGVDNVIEFERNLLSLDGQTEYGTCKDKVSLLNVDEYRKYRSLIPNAEYWWWLITPDSTKCNNDERWLAVVAPSGGVNYNNFSINRGVRPFCIFSSAIFESEE